MQVRPQIEELWPTRVGFYQLEGHEAEAQIAALYAQGTRDSLIIETASDLGQITSNISGKIWQKITLVQHHIEVQPPSSYEVDELSPGITRTVPSAVSP